MAVRRRSSLPRLVALAVAAVALVVVIGSIGFGLGDLNPFKTETKDRSQPVLLKSLRRISEYHAASARMQVIVDVEQDAKYLPSFIKGSRTLLVAGGSVDASVNFAALDARSIRVNGDRTAVTVTLPRATLSDARVDLQHTRVVDQDRGLVDRVGDAVGSGGTDQERQLLAKAQQKLADAARADPQILRTAEGNTRAMLDGLFRGLGFKQVTIRFAAPPAT